MKNRVVCRGLLSVFLMAIGPQSSQADTVSGAMISLQQALDMTRSNNPEIRSALKFWEAAQKNRDQAATPEGPRLDLERMYAPVGESVLTGAEERNWALTQELPFPGKLFYRHRAALAQVGMARQKYEAKVREVLSRARTAYAMLYLAYKSQELFNENIDFMRRFTKIAESKYVAGHVGQSDVLKAQVELTKMLNMLVVINQEKEEAQAMLTALMGATTEVMPVVPMELQSAQLTKSLAEFEALALNHRPELKESVLGLERASEALRLARLEYWPDLMLGYRRRQDMTLGKSQDAVIGLTLPLWFWRPSAMVKEAQTEKEMAEAEFKSMQLMTLSDVRIAYSRAQTAGRLLELYRTGVLPQAQAALKVAEAGYQSGKTSFLDLVDAQRTLLSFQLEHYQYKADYEIRLAQLERVIGVEAGYEK